MRVVGSFQNVVDDVGGVVALAAQVHNTTFGKSVRDLVASKVIANSSDMHPLFREWLGWSVVDWLCSSCHHDGAGDLIRSSHIASGLDLNNVIEVRTHQPKGIHHHVAMIECSSSRTVSRQWHAEPKKVISNRQRVMRYTRTYVGCNHKIILLLAKSLLRDVLLDVESLIVHSVPSRKLLLRLLEETSRDVSEGERLNLHVGVLVRQKLSDGTKLLVHARGEDALFVESVEQVILEPNCQRFDFSTEDPCHVNRKLRHNGGIDCLRDPRVCNDIHDGVFSCGESILLVACDELCLVQVLALLDAVLNNERYELLDQILQVDELLLCWKTPDLDGTGRGTIVRDVANIRLPVESQPRKGSLVLSRCPVHLQTLNHKERLRQSIVTLDTAFDAGETNR
ncbi:hypothetical protein HG531_001522 [Fusarium graminearum]|nr:hypothetical protein HG531_001522 [Fusarium graminearum]